MNEIFFTSDTHFGHKNIINYEKRPFESIEEMDKVLIENWNKKVKKNDRVYILGDFAFGDKEYTLNILKQLNGQKFLVRGNHDKIVDDIDVAKQFVWIKDYYELKHNKEKIVLFHYPIQVWNRKHHEAMHLYGHVHSDQENHHPMVAELENAYNVGTDVNDFAPVSYTELKSRKKVVSDMSMLSKLLMQFKDYGIGVQYFSAEFAIEMKENVGWCGIATVNGETLLASGYDMPIKAVLEVIKKIKEKRGDFNKEE